MTAHANIRSFDPYDFSSRHIGPSPTEVSLMCETIGVATVDELIDQTVPPTIRQHIPLDLGPALSESEVLARLGKTAAKNRVLCSMIGQGYYGTVIPPVILRNVLENPAWYTAYTPYQAEISQGRLEALLNFQTMIVDLTGLDIANASLLDEATAAAEAMAMVKRVCSSKATVFFVDEDCHPQTIAVIQTRAEPLGWRVVVGNPLDDIDPGSVFGALLQYPGSSGEIRDFRTIIAALHSAGALAVMNADPLALILLVPPGELGADIAIGATQRFGMPMGFGGPHAAYIAAREQFKRALPGRLVGVSVDSRGQRAYRLALQTREQHIRREKATSNICTAEVLPAVIASMYAVYHGPEGLKQIACRIHDSAATLAAGLIARGWLIETKHFFDTITLDVGNRQETVLRRAVEEGINLRKVGSTRIGISCDETTTAADIDAVWEAFGPAHGDKAASSAPVLEPPASAAVAAWPRELNRKSEFLTHPVFNSFHSETELMRYMRRLADCDLALDRCMIPLGSCTMKLNPATAMMPISWPEFANIHPFAPCDQTAGYADMLTDLGSKLCAISGFDSISFQPNSGAQGELAGLLAIRTFHNSRGQRDRRVCLIPSSAHGTNPASAHMAGMEVVVVNCDAAGNVDLHDLHSKVQQHAGKLAAVMITYPSTHGVFEADVRDICDVVHAHGGQVYLDGANLNAQVGLCRPGDYGADVSHLNLHKTFCIPHGGGGPGMGPICVKAHLAPFLPGHPERPELPRGGPVSAAPFGSAAILAISWAYVLMMGGEGLTRASKIAILNANYVASRLAASYPILFKGRFGRVAHECILDIRPLKNKTGVSADDIAKRLIDYGFHAPTMSFPVPGTLMIEPTESESKTELDRFCDAMITIRNEIQAIEDGCMSRDNNPLRHAPHTAADLTDDRWDRPYSRKQACFPVKSLCLQKYWCPVNRIDNAYGDRNLFCVCPPIGDHYEIAAQ